MGNTRGGYSVSPIFIRFVGEEELDEMTLFAGSPVARDLASKLGEFAKNYLGPRRMVLAGDIGEACSLIELVSENYERFLWTENSPKIL